MILIGGLLILVVIADGVRRVLADRRNVIRMGKSLSQLSELADDDIVNPELPYGGARSVPRSEYDPQASATRDPVVAPPRKPVRRPLDEGPEQTTAGRSGGASNAQPEALPGSQHGTETPPGGAVADGDAGADAPASPPVTPELPPEPVFDFTPDPAIYAESEENDPSFDYQLDPPLGAEPDFGFETGAAAEAEAHPEPEPEPESAATLNAQPDEVLIINVLSRDKNGFNGADLLEVLLACDVRFGDMDIFHRFEGAQGQGRIQFSIANLVKPGTFDLEGIKEFYTPGVCMFLQLPGPERPLEAFDCMAEIATCIVKNLQGEMRDENHSVLTAQTMEHYRQRIREYERKRLMRAAHRSA